ncbi:hypothetical protein [Fischerella sp. PCC 9605]|uniref:hypothetical protein n=1 Tax=Fischerella sp. PCC 9605 TaxID=1173024 RepID=UPI00047DAAE8|nr:hypothetical protein [Fischerella sp. PCC 9605]
MNTNNQHQGAIFLLLLAVLILSSCTPKPTVTANSEPSAAIEPKEVTIDNIVDNSSTFLGKTVTVTAEVQNALSRNAFALDDKDFAGDEFLLVVSSTPAENIQVGSRVQVTGTVRRFDRDEVAKKYNLDAIRPIPAFSEKLPAIVAESTEVVQ